jgi:hypothetical protein
LLVKVLVGGDAVKTLVKLSILAIQQQQLVLVDTLIAPTNTML